MEPVDARFLPLPGNVMPRFAGIPTFMRLPHREPGDCGDVDIGLVGVPFDTATSNTPVRATAPGSCATSPR